MNLYMPLNTVSREIRLISFSGSATNKTSCEMRIASLDSAPKYTALSYLWGKPDCTKTILVNAIPLSITKSLFEALRSLHTHYKDETFWIDALCIDQENKDEKVTQIPLMGEIYSKSWQTIAWLGPAADDSDAAFDLLRRWQVRQTSPIISQGCSPENYHRCWERGDEHVDKNMVVLFQTSVSEEKPISSWVDNTTQSDVNIKPATHQQREKFSNWAKHIVTSVLYNEATESSLDALIGILKRPYWTRVWIKQEFALASKLIIGCGNEFMDGEEFRQASQAAMTIHKYAGLEGCAQRLDGTLTQFPIIDTLLIRIKPLWGLRASYAQVGRPGLPLWILVNLTIVADTTVEVDRLFGILGLVRAHDFEIEVTYDKPVEDVFFNLTINFIFKSNVQFDCLCIAGDGLSHKSKTFSTSEDPVRSPSWVPSYQSEGQLYLGPEFPATWACEKLPPECWISPDGKKLRTPGIIFDKITKTLPGATDDRNPLTYIKEWFRLAMKYRDTHPSGLPLLQVFFRTLIRENFTIGSPYNFRDAHCQWLFFQMMSGFLAFVTHFRIPGVESDGRGVIDQAKERLSPEDLERFRSFECPGWLRPFVAWLTLPPFNLRTFEMSEILAHFCGRQEDGPVLSVPDEVLWSEETNPGVGRFLAEIIKEAISHRSCFFVTEKGYMGVGPPGLAISDELCFLPGGTMPVACKAEENEKFHGDHHYSLVGACYLYGIMHGEIGKRSNVEEMKLVVTFI